MTGASAAAILESRGLHPSERGAKTRLFATALEAFASEHASEPAGLWWVPGRLEVFGKHTDYCGGRSLVGTVPRGFAVAMAARHDGVVRIRDARRGQELSINQAAAADGVAPVQTGWRNYAQVVVRRLARNFPGREFGADIVLASDLPSASGMSSSSALMVGLAAALGERAGVAGDPRWQADIRLPEHAAGYYACIENGRTFGALSGDEGVGTHGGSEDHLAIVCGGPDRLRAWRFVPIAPEGDAAIPDDWAFVIASSGVAADKTGAARDDYNRLSREASELLTLWNSREAPQPSLRAALASHADAPRHLRDLAAHGGSDALVRRLDHFIREDARIHEALAAFASADAAAVTALADASQADAEVLLRNQVPETSTLARLARELGAFGSSGFGAGFGGSVWALVANADAEAFAMRWLAAYRARFPERTDAVTFVGHPGPSLARVDLR